ncbi:MAG: HEAT repeat domain-containing protein [Spirochaetes bacterium]|nr:HEAT repeat domain-containing protein [Spirochaetota bacterium]
MKLKMIYCLSVLIMSAGISAAESADLAKEIRLISKKMSISEEEQALLITGLKSSDWRIRKSAAEAFEKCDKIYDDNLLVLINALDDKTGNVQFAVGKTLHRLLIKDHNRVNIYSKILRETENNEIKAQLFQIFYFSQIIPGDISLLSIKEFDNPDHYVGASAALCVARYNNERGLYLNKIAKLLNDNNIAVQMWTICAIGHFGAEAVSVLPQIELFLSSKEYVLKKSAIEAIMRIGKPSTSSYPVIVNMLKDKEITVRLNSLILIDTFDISTNGILNVLMEILDNEFTVAKKDSIMQSLFSNKDHEMFRIMLMKSIVKRDPGLQKSRALIDKGMDDPVDEVKSTARTLIHDFNVIK